MPKIEEGEQLSRIASFTPRPGQQRLGQGAFDDNTAELVLERGAREASDARKSAATMGTVGQAFGVAQGIWANMEKKQELLDQYNHFLYELKRAKLGSIT